MSWSRPGPESNSLLNSFLSLFRVPAIDPVCLRLLPYICLLILTGCSLHDEEAALQSQLRMRDAEIRRLNGRVETLQAELKDQDQELQARREQQNSATSRTVGFSAETQAAWGSVTDVQLHALTSSSKLEGNRLVTHLVLQPLDDQKEVVKVAGELTVTLSVIDTDNAVRRITSQEYSMTDTRELWARGLVSTGYHVDLAADAGHLAGQIRKVMVSVVLNLGGDRKYTVSEFVSYSGTSSGSDEQPEL